MNWKLKWEIQSIKAEHLTEDEFRNDFRGKWWKYLNAIKIEHQRWILFHILSFKFWREYTSEKLRKEQIHMKETQTKKIYHMNL